jgi:hypothetical protein
VPTLRKNVKSGAPAFNGRSHETKTGPPVLTFPRDIWYVVPVPAFVPRKNLWFYPDRSKKGATFEKYREAWWILMGRKK